MVIDFIFFFRGISHEMVDAVTAIMTKKVDGETTSLKELTKTFQEMSSAERNSLLGCLLYPSNVEAVAASPMVRTTVPVIWGWRGKLKWIYFRFSVAGF